MTQTSSILNYIIFFLKKTKSFQNEKKLYRNLGPLCGVLSPQCSRWTEVYALKSCLSNLISQAHHNLIGKAHHNLISQKHHNLIGQEHHNLIGQAHHNLIGSALQFD